MCRAMCGSVTLATDLEEFRCSQNSLCLLHVLFGINFVSVVLFDYVEAERQDKERRAVLEQNMRLMYEDRKKQLEMVRHYERREEHKGRRG